MTETPEPVRLTELVAELLVKARGARSGRAARGVYGGRFLKQALLTLTAGASLAEHEAPPEATLQVIDGRVTLDAGEDSWELGSGELIAIPPTRHSVTAVEDSAFLLTIRTDVGES